ncbi:FAD-dependent oxidoreductase [Microbacterium sp. NIBRBAC000506063]|uniref:FAD-dependent oxidoreductase n=1 Tax=Microbacterium sp. NIBRBAC000506063 TaxID=2734618 RepID=UPI0039815E72
MESFEVAVVGMGALGSAAAYHAARKGATVVAFEQFELGHVRGASHDTSRIIRTSYGAPSTCGSRSRRTETGPSSKRSRARSSRRSPAG